MQNSNKNNEKVDYRLLDDGTFVINNYNKSRTFSSFFPGIAGIKGIPMWAFYVNRNQGIASFGVKDKNYSILEFYTANNAYGLCATQGFRTFIKIKEKNGEIFYEPFMNNPPDIGVEPEQKMFIRRHEIIFEDHNKALGIRTRVRYFTLPNEPIAALVRTLEIENTGKKQLDIEVIDGLPKIVPYWVDHWVLKHMSTTAQAWTLATNLGRNAPFYRLKVEINDKTDVTVVTKGNFYFGIVKTARGVSMARPIVDPDIVFGSDMAFVSPQAFINGRIFNPGQEQMRSNKYPSAMSYFANSLPSGGKVKLYSMTGHIESEAALNTFCKRAGKVEYFEKKANENKDIITGLTDVIATESAISAFDLYCRSTYMDNLMRGGMPILLPAGNGKLVYYVYSRKHGDLERDYNFFHISPTYYSQGNGNFRDMNQNKRNDIFFNPEIKDFNVLYFYNLLQLDGYNPLLVKGSSFFMDIKSRSAVSVFKKYVDRRDKEQARDFFSKRFEPGSLLLFLEEKNIRLKISSDEFLRAVLGASQCMHDSEHGEGYWIDHWTYNLDLLESYLAVYPEKLNEILFGKKEFTFYDNAHVVVARPEKYVNANGKIRQFDSVMLDTNKAKLLRNRACEPHIVRDKKGKGEVYKTTLISKIVCLVANKLSSLDPEGIGIEMEAEKPGWYDALNGLPGVFGSSVCETFELKRQLQFLIKSISLLGLESDDGFHVPEEVYDFISGLEQLLLKSFGITNFQFWDSSAAIKEHYRKETTLGISGNEKLITIGHALRFFKLSLDKIDRGLSRAKDSKTGLYYTYFAHEAVSFKINKKISHKGWPCVDVKKFKARPLPLFLEAEVHYLKTDTGRKDASRVYSLMKKSPLYDQKLGMYKVNASLANEPADIGRCTVFSAGWLENESIWLHMEYKYLLELLKSGLCSEFVAEFKKAGVCFLSPEMYGRSILENSSFLSSSAFPDKNNWGRGFVARLSGSTAEFIEIWLNMTCGSKPFFMDKDGKLAIIFKPELMKEFFTTENIFSFNFLGRIKVVYHNPLRRNLCGKNTNAKEISIIWNDGKKENILGGIISGGNAVKIRELKAKQIDVFF